MEFGSDEFFHKLKTEVMREDGNGDIYDILDRKIRKITYPIIRSKIPAGYVEDVYQEVFFSVWRSLSSYLIYMEEKMESQRVAWLLKVTERRIADFWEKMYKGHGKEIYLEDMEREPSAADKEKEEFTVRMQEVLLLLFSIPTSPEKIISYVYSKILLSSETNSGKPSITAEYLRGRKLFDILKMMRRDMEEYLGVQVPEYIFRPLAEKLEKMENGQMVGDRIYEMDIKKIVDGTNRIQKKMKAAR